MVYLFIFPCKNVMGLCCFIFQCKKTHSSADKQERRRAKVRLDKIRGGLGLLDKQLDALRSSELDKELMQSLKQSSQAMKNAGLGSGAVEAESVMNELDGQLRDAEELTSVLATPLQDDDGAIDVDAELDLIAEESCVAPGFSSSMLKDSETVPAPKTKLPAVVEETPAPQKLSKKWPTQVMGNTAEAPTARMLDETGW